MLKTTWTSGGSVFVLCVGCAFTAACAREVGNQTLPYTAPATTFATPSSSSGYGSPAYGASVRVQGEAPPPISGGTLAVTADDALVASDPDRDRIYVVTSADGTFARGRAQTVTIALQPGDEPGRVVAGAQPLVYVVLRRGGAVVTVRTSDGTIVARTPVCTAPRGIAYDASAHSVYVACNTGELYSLPEGGGAPTLLSMLDTDLRDVVLGRDTDGSEVIYVSRFRSAEVYALHSDGSVIRQFGPSAMVSQSGRSLGQSFSPTVAWRMIPDGHGNVLLSHQRALVDEPTAVTPVSPVAAYYASSIELQQCGSAVVHSTISSLSIADASPPVANPELFGAVLPVDIAISPITTGSPNQQITIIAAGNSRFVTAPYSQLQTYAMASLDNGTIGCGAAASRYVGAIADLGTDWNLGGSNLQLIAAAYRADGTLVVQSREPPVLEVLTGSGATAVVSLDGVPFDPNADPTMSTNANSVEDTGHAIFHSNSGGAIACASCHPEGGDDGHVWVFTGEGIRRTQDLRGGLLARAPFHWAGEESDLNHLMSDIFVTRMTGPVLAQPQIDALGHWLDQSQPLPRAAIVDAAAVARGQTLFEDSSVGCATCHSGDLHTNNQIVDVGTRGSFKVPSLVGLRWRAPYMHDGCAATLQDRFGPCGGGDAHGHTSQLTRDQIGDMIAYLQSL